MDNFGSRLKALRMQKGLTQSEAADDLFVTRQAVSNWEQEKNFPDLNSIVLISQLYSISLDELLKGERKVVKQLQKELNKISGIDLTGLIFMLFLAFIIPIVGIAFSGYVLAVQKKKNYPAWSKVVAIIAIVFQIVYMIVLFLNGYLPSETVTNTHS